MSASDSPLAMPVTRPSGTLRIFPSMRKTALSNDSRVRVLASKNAVITSFPSSGWDVATSLSSSTAANRHSSATMARVSSA